MKLTGIKLENCFDSFTGVLSKLTQHYKENMKIEVFKILGSIEIIGNPVKFFGNIGSGFVDLIEKPKEGLVKGPLEAGIGLVQGTTSLARNIFTAVFDSLRMISGSLANGTSNLTLV